MRRASRQSNFGESSSSTSIFSSSVCEDNQQNQQRKWCPPSSTIEESGPCSQSTEDDIFCFFDMDSLPDIQFDDSTLAEHAHDVQRQLLQTKFGSEYNITPEPIASSSNTEVYTAFHKHNQHEAMALKCKFTNGDHEEEESVFNEIQILQHLNANSCKNVISLEKVFIEQDLSVLVMPCMQQTLEEFIQCKKNLTIETLLGISSQLIQGLKNIHTLGVIHNDIKPSNIMLNFNGNAVEVKYIDFECSLIDLARKELHFDKCGSKKYMSPEKVCNAGYSFASDWWSLGVVLYYMLAGREPWRALGRYKKAILNQHINLQALRHDNDPLRDKLVGLTEQLLVRNVEEREKNVSKCV